nr:transglutaminase family protein [Psychrobacter sp. JCM 18901]
MKMPFVKDVTHVGTTAAESFATSAGVCQDHTHVFLGCLRDQHIPARYVSGYLYDDTENHMASYAWAEVWLDGYWYTFDISNQLFQPSSHVYVAIGRDYLDTAPVRGVRMGGGYENLYSQVLVSRLS